MIYVITLNRLSQTVIFIEHLNMSKHRGNIARPIQTVVDIKIRQNYQLRMTYILSHEHVLALQTKTSGSRLIFILADC